MAEAVRLLDHRQNITVSVVDLRRHFPILFSLKVSEVVENGEAESTIIFVNLRGREAVEDVQVIPELIDRLHGLGGHGFEH